MEEVEHIISKFQQDGFAVIEDFLTIDEIDLMKTECTELVNKMSESDHRTVFSTTDNQQNIRDEYFISSGDKIRGFFEEGALDDQGNMKVEKHLALNKIGHALHVFSPVFQQFTNSDRIKRLLKHLQFVDPVVVQSMYIFKQPLIGGVVTPHQDSTYLYTEPMKVIGFWLALDDALAENGCLSFIPGSHRSGLYGDYRLVRKSSENHVQCVYEGDKPTYDEKEFVEVPVKKGALVLIDGLVVHQSKQNSSSQSRHVYTFHVYDSAAAKWNERNWLQATSTETFTHL